MGWRSLLLVPVVCSGAYWLLTVWTMRVFFSRRPARRPASARRPRVSLIKPVCGLEKGLEENLASALDQDYPDYEVVFSVQGPQDPALPVLERLRARAPERVKVVVDESCAGPNGRLSNILNATERADGEVLVYSDSDMRLGRDYLETVTAPLEDPGVGVACTVYRAWGARDLPETLELLSLNADFIPSLVFATVTGASPACPGASQAIRRETLERIGGLAPMAHSLVEDYDLGLAVRRAGLRIEIVPHVERTGIDLAGCRAWWRHQVYWDQNTRAANPAGHFFTVLVRGIPFAALYALLGGAYGAAWLAGCAALRVATYAACARSLGDEEGLGKSWLLPVRDLAGLAVWAASFAQRTVHWKGRVFELQGNRMVELVS
ncbi:MAG: bacteriohopanetetrol glucosamine biosynthesis glycosyltransferase HpnI [Elusimicrobia bacterium]|nr:bacteriohopanetetrol glucosamine biosynthesis glycosyltransferase HpnI [Elusimicrobiota bacterium]